MKDWIKVKDAAAEVEVNPQTIYRWIRKGLIPSKRWGVRGQYRVNLSGVEEMMKKSTGPQPAAPSE